MLTRKSILVLFISLGLVCPLIGQQLLKGSVRDKQSGAPISFASIGIKHQSIGVVSNLEGDFQIPNSYQERGDTIVLSCIGYDRLELPLRSLLKEQVNVIRLQKGIYALPEAVVQSKKRRLSANRIVRRAIKNIPKNYPQSPFSYMGYYRDYQKKEEEYINLNEAIVEIFDQGFQTEDQTHTALKLYDLKLNEEFTIDTTTSIAYDNEVDKFVPNARLTPFGGNELSILLMHDAIRNHAVHAYSFVDTFALHFARNHKFKLLAPTTSGDLILHRIAFEGQYPYVSSKFHIDGEIYIEHDTYAIHKLVYSVYTEKDEAKELVYDIQLEYSKIEELMYLNYISFNNLFHMAKPPLFRAEEINFDTTRSRNDAFSNSIIDQKTRINIRLNKPAERTSALNPDNYIIRLKNKKLDIATVNLGAGGSAINLYLKSSTEVEQLNINPGKWLPLLTLEFDNIYDQENNKLNEPVYEEVHQFRELFRQKVTHYPSPPKNLFFIRKDTILSANLIHLTESQRTDDYWMNTPLKQ